MAEAEEHHHRRREIDQERRRWNDTALDQLAGRVGSLEDEVNVAQALAGLPQRVSDLKDAVRDLREAQRDAAGLEERRIGSVRAEIGELRKMLLDTPMLTRDAVRHGVDWKTVLAVAATIAVPIVVALIAVIAK